MSIPVSAVPAVKTYLLGLLQARPELDPTNRILVAYAEPAVLEYQPDTVFLGDVQGAFSGGAMVGSGGALARDEDFDLDVHVVSFYGLDDAAGVEGRAYTLAAVVCDAVRQDPSLGGLVIETWPTRYQATDVFADDPIGDEPTLGRRMHITQTLHISTTS